ncbi:MAG: two-component system response regulator [Candidatus Omnitrophota bacterium]|nr:MAG: two-component system response regulator [Candidatus Omnitrophota bacterium]
MAKILIVEDERDIRSLVAKALSAKGYEVFEASNGYEGWYMLQKEKPDLVILDIMMPVMDGMEVLKKIRNHPEFKEMPVIMLTGKSEDKDILEGYSVGADYYITKPFDIKTVLIGVKMMLGEKI